MSSANSFARWSKRAQSIVFDWAQAHPNDPRSAAEALHLLVGSTGYGCRDQRTGANSEGAFQTI